MEKDVGKVKKNETTEIIIRIDEYKGKKGLTIREYVTSEKYTGFSKSGTRIPADEFLNFRDMINSISLDELTAPASTESKKGKKEKKPQEVKKEESPGGEVEVKCEEDEAKEELEEE